MIRWWWIIAEIIVLGLMLAVVFFSKVEAQQSATLMWDASTGATGYKLYYGSVSGTYTQVVDVGNVTTYVIPNLAPAVYYFVVTAYNANGESGYSNQVSKEITTTTTTTTTTSTTTTTTLNHRPMIVSLTPPNAVNIVNSNRPFTVGYSDEDGAQTISVADLYLSGNAGIHFEWVSYLAASNQFVLVGLIDSCTPGQSKLLTNAYVSLNCAFSSAVKTGNNLTVVFHLLPRALSSGIVYRLFPAVKDQAGQSGAIFAGTWSIQ